MTSSLAFFLAPGMAGGSALVSAAGIAEGSVGAQGPAVVVGAGDPAVTGSKPFLLLVTLFVDDSGSITNSGNAGAIRLGHNRQIDEYVASGRQDVLIRTRYLNGHELFPFSRPADAVRMDSTNYDPHQGTTPLYDQTFEVLGEVEAAAARHSGQCDVHTMTYLLTDGHDEGSERKLPADVKGVVDRMIASGIHAVFGMAVDDRRTDFRRVFSEMGIPAQCIEVIGRSPDDIDRGMRTVSSTSLGAQDPGSFRATTRMGFTQPQPPRHEGTARPFSGSTAPRPGSSSSGPLSVRSPEEQGEVERGALLWSPSPNTFLWEPGSGWKEEGVSPFTWSGNGSAGFYELEAPPEGQWYLIGRSSREPESWQRRIADERGRSLDLEGLMSSQHLTFVPLIDKRGESSPLSRVSLLIGTEMGKTRVIPLSQGLTGLDPDDPQRDQPPSSVGLTIVSGASVLLRLALGVVFRLKRR